MRDAHAIDLAKLYNEIMDAARAHEAAGRSHLADRFRRLARSVAKSLDDHICEARLTRA